MYGRIKLALTCLVGIALGLFSARYVAGGGLGLVATSRDGWTAWPTAGLNTMDPYTKTHFLADGRLPDNRREIVEFEATSDAEGSRLDRDCSYAIKGRLDWSRWWSLTTGGLRADARASSPVSLHSGNVVYEADGSLVVRLAAEPHTGNWLGVPPGGDLRLILRFYDPASASRANPAAMTLPRIERESCR